MNILDKIIEHKKGSLAERDLVKDMSLLKKHPNLSRACLSLKSVLSVSKIPGIIAEYKRASPSEGIINENATLESVIENYDKVALAMSILTDNKFFGGKLDYITQVRNSVNKPILRKDFIIHPVQLFEAKAAGADIVLLIAAVLTSAEIDELARQAHQLGLEVLLEVHNKEELDKIRDQPDILGINNRNLKDFSTDINRSIRLMDHVPDDWICISESGIHEPEQALRLTEAGFHGFLIGTQFMREKEPGKACQHFVHQFQQLYED